MALPRVEAGSYFSPFERAPFVAAAEILLEGCPVPVTPQDAMRNMEVYLNEARSKRAWRIRILLVLVELTPLFLLGKGRFSRLSLEERRKIMFNQFIHGKHLWAICGKIKQLVYLGVYGDKRAGRAIGFVPWQERARFKNIKPSEIKLEVHPMPEFAPKPAFVPRPQAITQASPDLSAPAQEASL